MQVLVFLLYAYKVIQLTGPGESHNLTASETGLQKHFVLNRLGKYINLAAPRWKENLLQKHKISWFQIKQLFISGSGFFEGSQDTHSRHQHLTVHFPQVTVSCNLCFHGHSESALAAVEFQDSTLKPYEISRVAQSKIGCLLLEVTPFPSPYIRTRSVISCPLQERPVGRSGPGVSAAWLL